jgi:hypothetical protein
LFVVDDGHWNSQQYDKTCSLQNKTQVRQYCLHISDLKILTNILKGLQLRKNAPLYYYEYSIYSITNLD